MKRLFNSKSKSYMAAVVITILLAIGCYILVGYRNDSTKLYTISDGTYTMSVDNNEYEYITFPRLIIMNDNIVFTYNPLSSYSNSGTYKIKNNRLIMTTQDQLYTYLFQIKGGDLIFIKKGSSEFINSNTAISPGVYDKAIFKREP